jgi:glycerol kinase
MTELRVDGAASRNNLLMQIQADVAGLRVVRASISETTALGAAYLAGLAIGFYKDIDAHWKADRIFEPHDIGTSLRDQWREAIDRVKT